MHPVVLVPMAQQYESLTPAERLALSLAPRAPALSWRAAGPRAAGQQAVRRRHLRGLILAIGISLLALTCVLALDIFTIRSGQPGAVFFSSGTTEAQAFAAIVAAGGLPIRATTSIFSDNAVVWIAASDDPAFFSTVIGMGALVVINPLAFNGCFLRSDT